MSQLVASAHKHFQQFSTVGGKSVRQWVRHGYDRRHAVSAMESLSRKVATACGEPVGRAGLVNVSTMFRAELSSFGLVKSQRGVYCRPDGDSRRPGARPV